MSDRSKPEAGPRSPLRRALPAGLSVAGLLIAFVVFWFQPQQLFIDERVNEPTPGGAPRGTEQGSSSGSAAVSAPASAAPVELARGTFGPLDHATSGTARLLQTGDGTRVVRLEDFATENGPDLYVYLTTTRSDGEEEAFDDEFVNLGRLKGNQGDQNYELTADVDLSRFRTVLIWCDRFNSAFGAADLSEA